jgi:hypothetical protein
MDSEWPDPRLQQKRVEGAMMPDVFGSVILLRGDCHAPGCSSER